MAHRSHLQLRKARERHLASRERELLATSWFTAFLGWGVKLLSHSEKRFAVETLESGTLFGHFEVSYRDLLVALLINRHAVLIHSARIRKPQKLILFEQQAARREAQRSLTRSRSRRGPLVGIPHVS